MARSGPGLTPQIPPEKSLLRSFPGNEAHNLFSGGPRSGVLGGGQKVYVEKVYVLFPSLKTSTRSNEGQRLGSRVVPSLWCYRAPIQNNTNGSTRLILSLRAYRSSSAKIS